jgi:hypothetical protein
MAINGIQPTVAGVFGVKDYTNLLNQSNGMGKLIGTALDMYKFKSGQAQQNEMQQAAQDFNAAEAEKNREHQINLDKARWQRDQSLLARQEALQAKKELGSFQSEAAPIIGMEIDETNPNAIRDKGNRLKAVIAKAKNIGDNDTLAAATQEYNRLFGMYGKDTGGERAGGALQQAEAAAQAQQIHDQTAAGIKEQIASGAVDSAMGMIADAIAADIISQDEADRYMALINAKSSDLANQRRSDITAAQTFADAQEARARKKLK